MDGVTLILIILISILACVCTILILTIFQMRKSMGKRIDYYHKVLERVIMNDDIIDSSFSTLSEAYGIEEGDLRNYISKKQQS